MRYRNNNYNIQFLQDPQLQSIEARYSSYCTQVFEKHIHDTHAVGIIHKGVSSAFLQNRIKTIHHGDVIYIPPGEVHACNPRQNDILVYTMFYIDQTLIQELNNALFLQDEPAHAGKIIRNDQLFQDFSRLYSMMAYSQDRLEKQTQLYNALSVLLSNCHSVAEQPPPQKYNKKCLSQAYQYLVDTLFDNVSLIELASHAQLSPYHFLRTFKAIYGLPPHAYRMQMRIHAARRMIAEGKPLAQIAHETGFTDQSHFTKRFKAYMGLTPSQFLHCLS